MKNVQYAYAKGLFCSFVHVLSNTLVTILCKYGNVCESSGEYKSHMRGIKMRKRRFPCAVLAIITLSHVSACKSKLRIILTVYAIMGIRNIFPIQPKYEELNMTKLARTARNKDAAEPTV